MPPQETAYQIWYRQVEANAREIVHFSSQRAEQKMKNWDECVAIIPFQKMFDNHVGTVTAAKQIARAICASHIKD